MADERCTECGMPCESTDYHPYAACLMFKACHNSATVKANLDGVVAFGYQMACEEGYKGSIDPCPSK